MWRRRVGGIIMVGAAYGPTVVVPASFGALDWHWLGGVFHFGGALAALPGLLLVAVFAPEVAFRRRDALTLLFPLRGVWVAWMIGARLAQLPHRDWPVRTEGVELPGRQMARIVTAVNGYRLWRQRRVQRRSDTHARRAISPGNKRPLTVTCEQHFTQVRQERTSA
jgi:hypothetical protein